MKNLVLALLLALSSLSICGNTFAAPPECKENQKNCEKATIADIKKEVLSLEEKQGLLVKKDAAMACKSQGLSCTFSNECCGNLFCTGGTAGARYCKQIGN